MSTPRETWIAKLIAAERAETEARDTVRRHRSHIAKLIAEAVANGVSHDRIARGILRHRLGHAPSIEERLREAERLRKRRRRGTARPIEGDRGSKNELTREKRHVRSSKEGNNMPEHLIRRKTVTTEEEFVSQPDEDRDDEDLDDCEDGAKTAAAVAAADEDEEGDEADED